MHAAAAMAAGLALLAPSAASAGRQNFTLFNNSGYTIEQVYVSTVDTKSWEEDVLGQNELDTGQSVHINFPTESDDCHWDLKIVYKDNTPAYWGNIDLCAISEITISYDETTGKTSADWK
jgi:hypothetical protein